MEQSPSLEAGQSLQLVKKFPAFYGTRKFLTVLTSARGKDQLDATIYADLLTQHVSGTNMPIIRSTNSDFRHRATSSEQCTHLAAQCYTTEAVSMFGYQKRKSLFVLLIMDILVRET